MKFFLLADDTNLLYADKDLRVLETVVKIRTELRKVCDWLVISKLTLNIKKYNFVIFRPHQKKSLNFEPEINMLDYDSAQYIPLEYKECVKYLGIIIDCNLNWKSPY